MDIEFIVQDTFALIRPQWRLATNFEEAYKVFQLAVAQDQKASGADKVVEQYDGAASEDESSEDEIDNADDLAGGDAEVDDDLSSMDEDGEVCLQLLIWGAYLLIHTNHFYPCGLGGGRPTGFRRP